MFATCCVVYVNIFAQDVALLYWALSVFAMLLHEESSLRIPGAAVLHGYVAAVHFWAGICKLNCNFLQGWWLQFA